MFFWQDLNYAWRQLIRTPGFLLVAVASLALGIGANTAVFSLLNTVLLKDLPVREPRQLVILTDPGSSGVGIGSSSGERGLLSYPEFQDLKRSASLFDGLLAVESDASRMQVRMDGAHEELLGKLVSGGYFSVLGVRPQLGRFFDDKVDAQLGAAPYAVISDGFWERRFGRSPNAIGASITFKNAVLTVVGVTPPGFFGETVGQSPDVWAPLSMQLQLEPGRDYLHPRPDPTEKVMWLHVFGRLKPQVSLAQANAEANGIFKRSLEDSYQSLSAESRKQFMDQRLRLREAATGASDLRDRFAEALYVVFAAVAITLLICCANLTNLLLARANSRRREITVRLALGAGKSRVVAQLFTESLLLSVLGAAGGLLLANVAAPLFIRMVSSSGDAVGLESALDVKVLFFTGAIAILTTIIFGLAPALRAAKTDINSTLRESGRGLTASSGRLRLGKLFVIGQVALSLILIIGAGLLLRTLLNLQNVDLGYARDKMLVIRVGAAAAGYKDDGLILIYQRLLQKFASTPGVRAATYSENGLFAGTESGDEIKVEGYTPHGKQDRSARFDQIGPGYFSTIGIPLMLGREIDERDHKGGPLVCVVNDAFAKLFFAGRNPLGKHVIDSYGDKRVAFEVVGVARNSRDHSLRDDVPPRFFLAIAQEPLGEFPEAMNFEIRTAADENGILNTLRRAVAGVDSNLPIVRARSLGDAISERVGQDRMLANLTIVFGALALILAAIGIFGILAYGVSQRTGEIGIRIAIGARQNHVTAMILRETAAMLGIGLAVGLVGAYFLTKLIQSRLFGLHAMDPLVLGGAVLLMGLIGLAAAYGPAWRASRIDPALALRND